MSKIKLAILSEYVDNQITLSQRRMERKRKYDGNAYLQGAADELETVLIQLNYIRESLKELKEGARC